jgi:hypothetical protein
MGTAGPRRRLFGPSSKRYAWWASIYAALAAASTAPPTGRMSSVEPSTKAGEHFHHVAHQVVRDLGVLDHDEAPTLRCKHCSEVLHPGADQAVTVLHHDGAHSWVGEQPEQLPARPVQARADLGDHLGRCCRDVGRVLHQPSDLAGQGRRADRPTTPGRRWPRPAGQPVAPRPGPSPSPTGGPAPAARLHGTSGTSTRKFEPTP